MMMQMAAPRTIRLPTPQPKQMEFMRSRAKYTCYGGARGGGKSWAIREKAVGLALRYAGIRIAILRKTLVDLKKNHIVPLRAWEKNELAGLMKYNANEKTFEFVNNSRIDMAYMATDSDADAWQGQAYDVIFIEEATQFKEEWFQILTMCLRTSDTLAPGVFFNPRMYLTCNPGGVGHAWVKRLFIDRQYRNSERPDDYCMIRATLDDNPYLMQQSPDYRRQLENLPEAQRRAMLYGEWDVFDGQFFPEFLEGTHTCKPFPIPAGWRRYRAFDYGFDMLALYWIAVDYDGRAWVYREFAEGCDLGDGHTGLIISDAAHKMTEQPDDADIFQTFAPPDMWNRRQDSGRSAAEIFAECGVFCTKASNNRVAGWNDLKEWLKPRPDGRPGIIVFDTCVHLIESMPLVLHDEKHPDDVATEPHAYTHFPDALRYFVAGHPYAPERPVQDADMREELERQAGEWDDINDYDPLF